MFVILCKLSGNNAMHVNGLMSSRKNSNHFTTIYKTWFSHLLHSDKNMTIRIWRQVSGADNLPPHTHTHRSFDIWAVICDCREINASPITFTLLVLSGCLPLKTGFVLTKCSPVS